LSIAPDVFYRPERWSSLESNDEIEVTSWLADKIAGAIALVIIGNVLGQARCYTAGWSIENQWKFSFESG
jgi:hypothetical protein